MKRKFTFLTAALVLLAFLALPMGMWGQTRGVNTFTFSELGYSNADDVTTVEGTNVTLTFDQGTNSSNAPKYYTTGTAVRMYTGNTLEVALNNQEGETRITAIGFTFSGTYTGSLQNWTGSETSVSFTNTAAGQARIQVIAVTFSDGGVVPTTHTVTYYANVTGVTPFVDTYVEGANVTLRAANTFTNEGYTFSEWNTQADGDGDPYDAGDVIENIQEDLEFYAIWAQDPVSDEQWVLTNLADLTENDVFVIVGKVSNNSYSMANDGTSNPVASSVTIQNDRITSSVSANIKWNISGNANSGYIFYPNGNSEKWLYCNTTASSGSNTNLRIGTGNRKTFVPDGTTLKTNDSNTGRYWNVYATTPDWRGYTSNSTNTIVSFYKKVTGGVIPPSISADNVEIVYDAISGSIAYTINNGVEGGNLTAEVTSSTIEDLVLGTVGEASIPFTCSPNDDPNVRTATVTLTYTYSNRETVTKDVTITQAAAPMVYNTIEAIFAKATEAGNTATDVTITFGNWVVSGVSGNNAYVTDGTHGFIIYNSGHGFVVGNVLSGTASCKVQLYKGSAELTQLTSTTEGLTVEENGTITPVTIAIPNLGGVNTGAVISFENLTYHNGTDKYLADTEGNQIKPYNTLYSEMSFTDQHVYNVTGVYLQYNTTKELLPRSAEDIVDVTPVAPIINAENVTIAYNATEGAIAYTITNPVVGTALQAETTADWISDIIVGEESVTFTTTVNEGTEDRTATFTLIYSGAENKVVTITQGHYVVDYATLPFEWDGNGNAPAGITNNGVDTYNSAPYLKFDGTGDNLILKFNETPGILTFDIKGNSFSGGTFTVQTSENGETYTDLETYTDFGTNGNDLKDNEEFVLGENVRYVKWIYTNKSTGNVALGDIHLAEYEAPQPSITIEPATLNVDAEQHLAIYLSLAYENIIAGNFTVHYYNAEGDEIEPVQGETWMTAGVVKPDDIYQVICVIMANEGEARTAYFKVSAKDAENNTIYSNLVTVNQAAAPTPFEPAVYTRATSITSGAHYIIVGLNGSDAYAMSEQKSNNRAAVIVSENGTEATVVNDTIYDVTISYVETVEETDYYSIYDARNLGYLYAAGGGNYLRTEATLSVDSKWAITFDAENGQASVVASQSSNRNVMQFNNNGSNKLFSCYASASQKPVYLYVKTDEVPANNEITIEGTDFGTEQNPTSAGYNLIASPFNNVNPQDVAGMLTGNYDLYYFDENGMTENELKEWCNYKTNSFLLKSGKGYLYASENDTTLNFIGAPYAGDGVVELDYTEGNRFAGWNLIGNPFSETAYLEDGRSFYVLDGTGSDLIETSGAIGVMQGVFVKATAIDETVTFTTTAPQTTNNAIHANLSSGSQLIDRATICFGEGQHLEKFQLNPNHTKIYFTEGSKDYAIVRSANEGEKPVSFKAETNGTYTISVNTDNVEMKYLHLIDNMTGADVDLLATPSYSFEARTSDYASRFRLVFNGTSVNENTDEAFAYYNGSEWVLNNMGSATLQVIDVTGRVLSTETLEGNATISLNQVPGVYMLRLVNSDSVRTQKIVVK